MVSNKKIHKKQFEIHTSTPMKEDHEKAYLKREKRNKEKAYTVGAVDKKKMKKLKGKENVANKSSHIKKIKFEVIETEEFEYDT